MFNIDYVRNMQLGILSIRKNYVGICVFKSAVGGYFQELKIWGYV